MRGILPPPLAQLVALEQVPDAGLIPCPALRRALAHETRPFTNQFDVEHRRGIGTRLWGARRKDQTPSARTYYVQTSRLDKARE